jgi:hypothetical protein
MVGAGVTVATCGAAAGGAMAAAHGVADAVQAQGRNEAAARGELVLSAAAPDSQSVQGCGG